MFPLLANVAKNAPRMLMIALKTSRVCTVVLYTSNLRKAGCGPRDANGDTTTKWPIMLRKLRK